MSKKKPDSKLFIWLLFLLPIVFIVFSFFVIYEILFPFDLQRFIDLFLYKIKFIGLFIFDIIVFFYLFRYHREMNLFFKVFFAVGLVLATYSNFQYALAKENGNLFNSSYIYYYWLYFGSLLPYHIPSYAYETTLLPLCLYFDSLAFMTGAPFLLLLVVFPPFLALPFFFFWIGFSIFYIVMPYSFKEKVFERLKNSLKRKRT